MFTRPIHVAILDDDPSCRTALTRFLKAQGMVVDTYATGGQFFDALALERQDCLLLDFEMPAMSGVDVLKHLGRLKIRIPTIILSAHDDVASRKSCQDAGAMEYLCKPVNADRLLHAVERIGNVQPENCAAQPMLPFRHRGRTADRFQILRP
jgi:FixJ family two-component response regulator